MDTQWTGLAASRGPKGDVSAIPSAPRMTWQQGFTGDPTKRAYIDGKHRGQRECARTHQPMLAAAYRAGELAGLVKMGAVVGALWALSWALGGRNRG